MSYAFVRYDQSDATVTLTLDRPKKRNALSMAMREELVAALRQAADDPSCAAIILTGDGDGFCSGADISETSGPEPLDMDVRRRRLALLQDVSRAIIEAPKPVIAAVHGAAYGAGFSIAVACDFVLAADSAKFCAIFCRLGLLPDAGILWTLPRRAGYGASRRLLMTGEPISSQEALDCGVADRVVAEAELLDHARDVARAAAKSAPLSVRYTKQALALDLPSLDAVFAYENDVQFALGDSEDTAEAKAAFFAKRPPRFNGR